MNMSGVSSSFSNKNLLPSTTMSKNLDRPSAGDDDDGGGLGPTDNSGGANEAVGNIYLGNFAKGTTTNFLPFDIFSSSFSTIPCKSPEMVGNVRFPFTYAQRKELERQAMIYKYMICSVPVPPHLLLQLSTNFTDFSASSTYNGRYSRNGDPEPGRCKRTDGKKWRCSREAAPHQKYCERHLHRGRPRSRKPVEVKNNGDHHKKTHVDQTKSLPIDTSSQQIVAANEPPLLFSAKADLSFSTPSFKGDQRDFGLALEGKMEHHMMEAFSVHTSVSPILHQDYVEHHRQPPSSIFPYSTSPMPEVGFIDAWLINDMYKTNNRTSESSIPLNDINLSPSLNLPLAQNVELGRIQTENIVEDYDHEHKTNGSIWSGPISWESFGGPLGEALQPGSLIFGSNLNSPYNSISTPATTVSSPSGVLHRTLFSDGSVCNSPSFGASTSEVAIQWLN